METPEEAVLQAAAEVVDAASSASHLCISWLPPKGALATVIQRMIREGRLPGDEDGMAAPLV